MSRILNDYPIPGSHSIVVGRHKPYLEKNNKDHSTDEDRYIVIGEINYKILVLYVSYTERSDVIRLISARKATASERREYYDSKERN